MTTWRIIGGVIFFILILGTGYWLSNAGKPLNTGMLTVHKLIAVAAIILLSIAVYKVQKASGLNGNEIASVVVTGVFFLGTIAFGGMLSLDKEMPLFVLRMHQILPYLTTISTGVTLFLLK